MRTECQPQESCLCVPPGYCLCPCIDAGTARCWRQSPGTTGKDSAWCDLTGSTLVHTYADEGLSGFSIDKRPGLRHALDDACTRRGVLVVYALSRLARNTKETLELGEQLARAGADLVSLSENIDTTSAAGKMVFRMLAVLAEFERDQISERTAMAMAHKRQQGQRISRHAPYGSQLTHDGLTLEPNPAEQAVVTIARTLRASGLSTRAIATPAGGARHAEPGRDGVYAQRHQRDGGGLGPYQGQRATTRQGDPMPKKVIDLEAIRQAEAQLDALLDAHPELRDPARHPALAEFLRTLHQEDTTDGDKDRGDRSSIRVRRNARSRFRSKWSPRCMRSSSSTPMTIATP